VERILRKGAEADIILTTWYGYPAVKKKRHEKAYLRPEINRFLILRRTVSEAKFLNIAKSLGVPTPIVYFVDPFSGEIIMQFVEGKRLKELLKEDRELGVKLFRRVGGNLALLHKSNIIHGDPTTSNLIITKEGSVVMIDFGLSFYSRRLEDKAVDLHLMRQVLNSEHFEVARSCFGNLMEGYRSVVGEGVADQTIRKVREIERRGRYVAARQV